MEKLKRKQKEGFSAISDNIEISSLEGTILSSFFPEAEEMTIKEIQERVDYSYERVNSALKSLEQKKIVASKQKGKTLVYSLDLSNSCSYSLGFIRYMLQRKIYFIKKHKNVYNAIKEVEKNPYTLGVILFGSYSKGTEAKQSDVDIICISSKKSETEHFIKSLKYKYNINFSSVVLLLHEFPDIKKDNPELWNDLKLYGIFFKGDGYFYSFIYENGKN
ncbi:MAG: nucleotidyltransferase domain-containing protein [Nanoarchaeota archaeon]